MWLEAYSVVATATALAVAVRHFRKKVDRPPAGKFFAPSPDVNRYLVVMRHVGGTIELYHGYDGLKARHAYELAPMEPGCIAEFYEWGESRGRKTA